MFGSGAQRVRVLSDAVRDLKATLDSAVATYRSGGKEIKVDTSLAGQIDTIRRSLDALVAQLTEVNYNLSALSKRPIVGMLGGGAEAELSRLVDSVDRLNESIRGAIAIVKR